MKYINLLPLFILVFLFSCSTHQEITKTPSHLQKKDRNIKIAPMPIGVNLEDRLKKIGAKIGNPIYIRIFKKERVLELYVKNQDGLFKLCKVYPICAYSGELGPKLKQGDKQSPEGFYYVTKRQLKKRSKYHLAINIGFPNQYDRYQKRTGSYIMIHGKCSSTGCYAMRNEPIEEIFMMANAALNHSQSKFSVHIFPFRMTDENLDQYKNNKWYPFWKNLKLGYDIFERYKVIPIVIASQNRYRFFIKKPKG